MAERRLMSKIEASSGKALPAIRYLVLAIFFVVALAVLATLTATLESDDPLGFLADYKDYLVIAEVVVLGILAVESGSRFLYSILVLRMPADTAAAIRLIARIVVYGVLLAAIVSLLTKNAAAAITAGAFAGMVAGFASQTVIGNAIAGVFMAISRPIHVGDNVTVGGNDGRVLAITLMHTVLDAEDREIMIPSSNIVTSVLIRHKDTQV